MVGANNNISPQVVQRLLTIYPSFSKESLSLSSLAFILKFLSARKRIIKSKPVLDFFNELS